MKAQRKGPVRVQADRAGKHLRRAASEVDRIAHEPAKRPQNSPPTETDWAQCDRLWFTFLRGCKARVRRTFPEELADAGFAKNLVFLPADDEVVLVAVVRRDGERLVRRYCRMSGFAAYARKHDEESHAALFDSLRDERILGCDETRDAVRRADDLRYAAEREARRRRYQT